MRRFAIVFACCLLVAGSTARAQVPDNQRSVALFEEGRKLVDRGDCPDAVPKLRESLHLQASVGAHLTLAECYEKVDLVLAWRENKEAERIALKKSDARSTYARAAAERLEAQLGIVRFVFASGDRDAEDLTVRVDGVAIDDFYYPGLAVPPGKHLVEVSAARRRSWREELQAKAGAAVMADILLPDAASVPPRLPPESPASPQPKSGSTQKTIALVSGGVGLAAIAAGAITGVISSAHASDAKKSCETSAEFTYPSRCDPARSDAMKRQNALAYDFATASTATFIVGGALLALGVVLYVTSPRSAATVSSQPFNLRSLPGTVIGGRW
jgi:hypothetical protein